MLSKYHKSRILGFLTLTLATPTFQSQRTPGGISPKEVKKNGVPFFPPEFFVARRFITRHQMHTPKRNPFSYTLPKFTSSPLETDTLRSK